MPLSLHRAASRRLRRLTRAWLAVTLCAACSADGKGCGSREPRPDVATINDAAVPTSDGSTTPPGAVAEFCQRLTDRVYDAPCSYLQRCCSTAEQARLQSDLDTLLDSACSPQNRTLYAERCALVFGAGVTAGRLRLHPERLEACASGLIANVAIPGECGAIGKLVLDGTTDYRAVPACLEAVEGLATMDAPCRANYECQSHYCAGTQYDDDSLLTDGRCAPTAGPSAECSSTTLEECLDALVCRAGTCQPRPTEGEACDAQGSCAAGHFCAFGTDGAAGVCHALRAVGETCTDSPECASHRCQSGRCTAFCAVAQATPDGG